MFCLLKLRPLSKTSVCLALPVANTLGRKSLASSHVAVPPWCTTIHLILSFIIRLIQAKLARDKTREQTGVDEYRNETVTITSWTGGEREKGE